MGTLFLAVYFLLRSYTSTLGYFETIPTFVPATMVNRTLLRSHFLTILLSVDPDWSVCYESRQEEKSLQLLGKINSPHLLFSF